MKETWKVESSVRASMLSLLDQQGDGGDHERDLSCSLFSFLSVVILCFNSSTLEGVSECWLLILWHSYTEARSGSPIRRLLGVDTFMVLIWVVWLISFIFCTFTLSSVFYFIICMLPDYLVLYLITCILPDYLYFTWLSLFHLIIFILPEYLYFTWSSFYLIICILPYYLYFTWLSAIKLEKVSFGGIVPIRRGTVQRIGCLRFSSTTLYYTLNIDLEKNL